MDINNFNFEKFKNYLVMYQRMDDTDRPIDTIYNVQYLISQRLGIPLDEVINSEDYKLWKDNEKQFLQTLLYSMVWYCENITDE